MLTVKFIDSDHEAILEAKTVSYYPDNAAGRIRELVVFGVPDCDGPWHIEKGRVFVMNASGQTVGNYDLG